nr:MAG TPA: hypothetical protein [Caudoviricetes sp.]
MPCINDGNSRLFDEIVYSPNQISGNRGCKGLVFLNIRRISMIVLVLLTMICYSLQLNLLLREYTLECWGIACNMLKQ